MPSLFACFLEVRREKIQKKYIKIKVKEQKDLCYQMGRNISKPWKRWKFVVKLLIFKHFKNYKLSINKLTPNDHSDSLEIIDFDFRFPKIQVKMHWIIIIIEEKWKNQIVWSISDKI